MVIIGITGPTGAGKTTALKELRKLGGAIVDFDAVYHGLLATSDQMQNDLQERFGRLTDPEGKFDRKKLGAVVFKDPDALEDLNRIVYPHIRKEVERILSKAERECISVAAVDGITILESGLGECCNATVAILAPTQERIRRICLREGITEDYARARVSAQKPDSWFRTNCTYTLMNDCNNADEFAEKARTLFQYIMEENENKPSKGGKDMKENTEKTKG